MIPAVAPLLLVAAGLAALAVGIATLRTFGPRYRVGRLLATTPRVTVADAAAIASSGRQRYVRVDGRIDAEVEFEDAAHRPLVFRRTRLAARSGRDWRTFEDSREQVAFDIRDGLDAIGIDVDVLSDGLVVVPRESVGVAADLGDRAADDLDPSTPVRAIVEQVSSVEHAIGLGVPVASGEPDAPPRLTAGLGRPLVLTTLEPQEAMRILAGGTGRPRLAAASLVVGTALVVAGLAWLGLSAVGAAVVRLVPIALAASPGPSQAVGGDPRSSGEGPGLVGEPLAAILGVALIAAAAVVVTLAYLRLTGGAGSRGRRQR